MKKVIIPALLWLGFPLYLRHPPAFFRMQSFPLLRALGVVLLLTTACKKQDNAPAAISQAQLEGRWQQGVGSYKILDSKGKVVDSGGEAAPNPALYHTLDATTWKMSGQLHNEYTYTRQDSAITRSFYYNGGKDHLNAEFRILQLTENHLVMRQTGSYLDGTKMLETVTYSR
jgi:hypothetical protein